MDEGQIFDRIQKTLDELVGSEPQLRVAFLLDAHGQLVAAAGETERIDMMHGSMSGAEPGTMVEALRGSGYDARFSEPDVHMLEALGGPEHLTTWNGVGVHVEVIGEQLILCALFDVDRTEEALQQRTTAARDALVELADAHRRLRDRHFTFETITDDDIRTLFTDEPALRTFEHADLRGRAAHRGGPDQKAHAEAALELVRAALERPNALGAWSLGAEVALLAGDLDCARAFARRVIRYWDGRPYRNPWDGRPGPSLISAHTVLGLVALREGDLETALTELDRAAHTPPDCVSSSYGPRIELAVALLAQGQYDAVVDFLTARAKSWELDEGRTDGWIASIRAGQDPDWDELLELARR